MGPYYIISGIFADKFYINRLETGYLIKMAKEVYNNQTVFPYYWHPGLSYKDSNGKIIYYFSQPLVVFTSSILTSKSFISLIPTLKTFRAPN